MSKNKREIRKNIIDLRNSIVRFSPLLADNIGLSMTPEELRWLYESIGIHYMTNRSFNDLYSLENLKQNLCNLTKLVEEKDGGR